MKVAVKHARAIQGHHISVDVEASDPELITWVGITLDGFSLATDPVDQAASNYEREFDQVGDAAPMMEHLLLVEARNNKGHSYFSHTSWIDPV